MNCKVDRDKPLPTGEPTEPIEKLQWNNNNQPLKNKTPAEVSGVKVEGSNKLITLIQNAQYKSFFPRCNPHRCCLALLP